MTPFGQDAVRHDLVAALATAQVADGKVEVGYPEYSAQNDHGSAAGRRKLSDLVARLSPCVVTWESEHTGGSSSKSHSDEQDRRFDTVLSGLEAQGWRASEPPVETPLSDGAFLLATFEKQEWTLHARRASTPTWKRSTLMVTEDDCFGRVTEEERALVEAPDAVR